MALPKITEPVSSSMGTLTLGKATLLKLLQRVCPRENRLEISILTLAQNRVAYA